jgi:cysteine synthase A
MTRIFDGVCDLIGGTPLLRLRRIEAVGGAELCAKLEAQNPSGSVKDRAASSMVAAAEADGTLRSGGLIVEATSGNTGIALAMIAAARGYRCILVMPEDMSTARQSILRAYGADVVLTSGEQGMAGAVAEAERIVAQHPGSFMPRQFLNPNNPAAHERTTAIEILDATDRHVTAFVAGVGTGGTLTGVARVLKAHRPDTLIVAVEPRSSAVLSGANPGSHGIQGLGAGFVPAVLDRTLIDEVVTVTDLEADRMATRLAREEGLLVGMSSGANVHAAQKIAARLPASARVVTILCDTGERYL